MGKMKLLFCWLILLLTMSTGCSEISTDQNQPQIQIVELEVGQNISSVITLFDASGQAVVGTATFRPDDDRLYLEVQDAPGYRLNDVRACLTPDLRQHRCSPWRLPEICRRHRRSFTFESEDIKPQLCTPNYRIFLRYRVIENRSLNFLYDETLESTRPHRSLTRLPSLFILRFAF
ncbi:hypothetical protein KKF05_03120 [Patescibacteria group bacterium]|nr:hypothetical protein [Patescibacteria group bacterium]MBU1029396.1 hypothetical protein [Patescibacteria group bacterium]MBU1915734.1 hypothetical protein [Patescibacteria group bacterium]